MRVAYPRAVKLLPRRNAETPSGEDDSGAADVVAKQSGKGRPTPKRREATGVRGPVTAPKTRKEAYARQKQLAKSQRTAAKSGTPMTAQQRREAIRAGDPAHLPRRDQGQTRKLARDWVDSHRLLSNYMLLLLPLLIFGYVVPFVSLIVIVVFLGLIFEWYIVGRRIRALAIERFGRADGSPMSLGWYAGSRAYLPRRWRLPAPQVSMRDKI